METGMEWWREGGMAEGACQTHWTVRKVDQNGILTTLGFFSPPVKGANHQTASEEFRLSAPKYPES